MHRGLTRIFFRRLFHTRTMAPKRARTEGGGGGGGSAPAETSGGGDVAEGRPGKRPQRAAASHAIATMKEQIAAENGSEASALAYATSSSSAATSSSASASKASTVLKFGNPDASGTVTATRLATVPADVLDVQEPGVRRTPELYVAPLPTFDAARGVLVFKDAPAFTPTLTPSQVLRAGSFGGYYFRPIASGVTGRVHVDAWREFPADWFAGLNPSTQIASPSKNTKVNKYKVDCGQDLRAWEESGWIVAADPLGWFHWYCRFYLGRRSADDARQISRWVGVAGGSGRWKTNLIHKVVLANAAYDDASVSPVVRQTLQHWGYALSEGDFEAYAKKVRAGKSTSFIKGS